MNPNKPTKFDEVAEKASIFRMLKIGIQSRLILWFCRDAFEIVVTDIVEEALENERK